MMFFFICILYSICIGELLVFFFDVVLANS